MAAQKIDTQAQLDTVRQIIGEENYPGCCRMIADGCYFWLVDSLADLEEIPVSEKVDDKDRAFCRTRFEAGETWAALPRRPVRVAAAEVFLGGGGSSYDSHGNYRGGGSNQGSIH